MDLEIDDFDTPFDEELQLSTLVSTNNIPEQFRNVFPNYTYFNRIQSEAFPTVYKSDESVVVSAPTGSGKTVIFELAILRLLSTNSFEDNNYRIIYVAPMKAICEERLLDWHKRFSSVGINCISVTGDSDHNSIAHILNHNLIITTPEKWDSLTRKWRHNKKIVDKIALFMIDEVHLLNDESRGATLEAIVSRMKTIQDFNDMKLGKDASHKIRFIAVSATIPNVEDIAEWLGKRRMPAKWFSFDDETRPVKLTKIVQGFYYNPNVSTPFKFDIMLSYKLQNIILTYAKGKPILIFCSTRKSVEMTAKYLTQNLSIRLSPEQNQVLRDEAFKISDQKVRECLIAGIGSHHAGLLPENRRIVEELFRQGDLPVLVTTSTLAIGVNLPAHLVIIKSTKMYACGEYKDYTETTVLQMIGRAGRPQFDTEGIAVILTTMEDKNKYENMVGRAQPIESSLHKHLTEHLNAEVALRTITDLGIAMQWLTSTFLHIRARRHPKHYGISIGLTPDQIDKKLLDICQIEINKLTRVGMITIDENASLNPTDTGTLMAKYCIHFDTMKLFTELKGNEILQQILCLVSRCHEYSDLYLRVNDKKSLNLLNKCKHRETIRFPLSGKIKTVDMKINCIIQAVLGCLQIMESSLQNEAQRIMKIGERVTRCIMEYVKLKPKHYLALLSAVTLAKCFQCKIWENSPHVSRQLTGIGSVMSTHLVAAGKTSFQQLLDANPRNLEMIIHRKSPMGSNIQAQIQHLPQYFLQLEEIMISPTVCKVNCVIRLSNLEAVKQKISVHSESLMILLIGDDENNILKYKEYTHNYMIQNYEVSMDLEMEFKTQTTIHGHFISENWAGIDCHSNLNLLQSPSEAQPKNTKEAPTVTKVVKPKKKQLENITVNAKPHVQKFISQYYNTVKKPNKTSVINQDDTDALLDSEDFDEEKLLQSSDENSDDRPKLNKINIQSNIIISKPKEEPIQQSKFIPPFNKKIVSKCIPDKATSTTTDDSKTTSEYNINEEEVSFSSSGDIREEFDKEFSPPISLQSNQDKFSISINSTSFVPIINNGKEEFQIIINNVPTINKQNLEEIKLITQKLEENDSISANSYQEEVKANNSIKESKYKFKKITPKPNLTAIKQNFNNSFNLNKENDNRRQQFNESKYNPSDSEQFNSSFYSNKIDSYNNQTFATCPQKIEFEKENRFQNNSKQFPNKMNLNNTINSQTTAIHPKLDKETNQHQNLKRNSSFSITPIEKQQKYQPTNSEPLNNLMFASSQNYNFDSQKCTLLQNSMPSTSVINNKNGISGFRSEFQQKMKFNQRNDLEAHGRGGSQLIGLNQSSQNLADKLAKKQRGVTLGPSRSQPLNKSISDYRDTNNKWKMFHGARRNVEFENCLLNSSPTYVNKIDIRNTFSQPIKKKIPRAPVLDMNKILSNAELEPDSTNDITPSKRIKFNPNTNSQQQLQNMKNEKKAISWRSPIVTSPETKHSPNMFKNIYSQPFATNLGLNESNYFKKHSTKLPDATPFTLNKEKHFPLRDSQHLFSQQSKSHSSNQFDNLCDTQQKRKVNLENFTNYIEKNYKPFVSSKPHTLVSNESPIDEEECLNNSLEIKFDEDNISDDNESQPEATSFIQSECDTSNNWNPNNSNEYGNDRRTQPNMRYNPNQNYWENENVTNPSLWENNEMWRPEFPMRPVMVAANHYPSFHWEQPMMMYNNGHVYNHHQYQPMELNYDENNFNFMSRPVSQRMRQQYQPFNYNYNVEENRKS